MSKPVPFHPPSISPRLGSNPRLAENRAVRREAARQVARQVQPERPRPVARPAAPPVHLMAHTPAPAPTIKSLRKTPAPAGAVPNPAGFATLNVAGAHADLSAEIQALQSSLSDLQQRSTFSALQSELTGIDTGLQRASDLLENARNKGYAYQADLETLLYETTGRWDHVRPQVIQIMTQQRSVVQAQINRLNPMIQSLNRVIVNPASAAGQLRNTQSLVNSQLSDIGRIESDLRQRYGPDQAQAQKLNARLTDIHWAMDQLRQAKFQLGRGEDLIMAVPSRWDQEGKDDPEGVLYLSNQRLIFERKEKIATKKVLFITTASELVQQVLIDQALTGLKEIKAESKGLFGHQDFLLVSFQAPGLEKLSLHLNGQDSKDWAALLERARSGQIEAERSTSSGGLTVADLSKPLTPAALLAIQSEVNALQDEIMLKASLQELAELENEVHSLKRRLVEVRARGYAIEKDLEADITVLAAQWDRVQRNTRATVEYQSKVLGEQMGSIQGDLQKVIGLSTNLAAARPLYMQIKSAVASLQAQADAAEATVLAQYDEYADEVECLAAHLEWVKWMLDALSTASFRLLATECGVAATEAVFSHAGSEPENGVLFLTDQRLLWEDRVGSYELKVDVPVAEILDVQNVSAAEDERETLYMRFGSKAPLLDARFFFALPVIQEWIQMISRARSGGFALDRAVEVSAEELERIRNAPETCQFCGAAFTSPIFRGQTELTCEYCGKITRI